MSLPEPSRGVLPLLLLAALLPACASYTRLSPEDRASLDREFTATDPVRYLRVSSNVTPFFGDASRKLLTPYAPEDVRLLDDTQGKPMNPGAVESVLPAGTKVRITRVEFPTGWVVAERLLYTPRTWPWVYLAVDGAPAGPPLILVLPPNLEKPEDFRAEVDKHLAPRELSAQLDALPANVREAVRAKKLLSGMTADAVRMAWGPPETVRRSLEGTSKHEEWSYPGGRRKALLTDGRLAGAEEAGASLLP